MTGKQAIELNKKWEAKALELAKEDYLNAVKEWAKVANKIMKGVNNG